eukprot:6983567-Alexandrium_andersonii.AAC.1
MCWAAPRVGSSARSSSATGHAGKLCNSLAAFVTRKARVMRLGSPSPASRAFLGQNPFVDEDAAD